MKKLFILLSAVMVLVGGCCSDCKAEDLINYVPADADGVVYVDAARLLNLSQFQELRKENAQFDEGWQEFEKQLKTYGLTKADLPSQLMMFFQGTGDAQNAGVLAITKISEKKLLEILDANKDKVTYVIKTIAERKAYVLTKKDQENSKAVLTYLKTNLVLACDDDKAEDLLKSVGKTRNEKLIAADAKADKKALLYVLYTNSKPAPPQDQNNPQMGMMGGNPLEGIDSAVVALDLIGKNQKDVNLKADIKCFDVQNAMQMTMQLKMLIMGMSSQFGQDPALGKEVTEAIKIEQKDKDINLEISISEELADKLKESVKKRQQAMMPGGSPSMSAPVMVAPSRSEKAPAPAK
jgi:hypothetical protein